MKRATSLCCVFGIAIGLGAGRPANASQVGRGFDLFTTVPGAFRTDIQFSDPSQGPLDGLIIPLKGHAPAGFADTIVERTAGLPSGTTGTIPIEIVAMDLASTNKITLDLNSGLQPYDVHIRLSPGILSTGGMGVTHNNPTGGTFDYFADIFVDIDFTPCGQPCGQTPPGLSLTAFPLNMNIFNAMWAHTPAPGVERRR